MLLMYCAKRASKLCYRGDILRTTPEPTLLPTTRIERCERYGAMRDQRARSGHTNFISIEREQVRCEVRARNLLGHDRLRRIHVQIDSAYRILDLARIPYRARL